MAELLTLARPYARAAFESASETDSINDWSDQLRTLAAISAEPKILDQLNGIEYHMGTAVGLHLQKFWISFAEVNVVMILEQHFGRPEGVKVGPGTAFGTILWR